MACLCASRRPISSNDPRSALITGVTASVAYHLKKKSSSSSTMRSAVGISLERAARFCSTICSSASRSYRKTLSNRPTSGSTSRGLATSTSTIGLRLRAFISDSIMPASIRGSCDAVAVTTTSASSSAWSSSSMGRARPFNLPANSTARSCVRFITTRSPGCSLARYLPARAPVSPAPTSRTLWRDKSPKTLVAIATPAYATDMAPRPIPVSLRARLPTCAAH